MENLAYCYRILLSDGYWYNTQRTAQDEETARRDVIAIAQLVEDRVTGDRLHAKKVQLLRIKKLAEKYPCERK